MTTTRKDLVWNIKKNLFRLSSIDIYNVARDLAASEADQDKLSLHDEEGCTDFVVAYMQSQNLLDSDDEGMAQLLMLNDVVNRVIASVDMPTNGSRDVDVHANPSPSTVNTDHVKQSHSEISTTTQPHPHAQSQLQVHTTSQPVKELRTMYEQLGEQLRRCEATTPLPAPVNSQQGESLSHTMPTPRVPERAVPLKDLHYLPRREFKVHGGQIGDQSSEMGFNGISKQIDEGVKEGFGEAEVVRGVLRVIKPGTFRDMLVNKDEMTVSELKGFLRSHLGEKTTTEMFQDLMCARQLDQESPQQFLYRMIGLKQKLLFQSKQANADISYDPKTIQEVFLHSIYQGLGSKHADIRQRLRPLIAHSQLTDEEILGQVMKMINDENEHQRRIGQLSRQPKATHAHAAKVETGDWPTNDKPKSGAAENNATIQQLSTQVENLSRMMATLMEKQMGSAQAAYQQTPPTQVSPHPQPYHSPQPPPNRYPQPARRQERQPCQAPQPLPNQYSQPPQSQERGRTSRCPNCTEQNRQECSHCFVCGEAGHRAVGCLKRTKFQGNGSRPQPRDSQRPGFTLSPNHYTPSPSHNLSPTNNSHT